MIFVRKKLNKPHTSFCNQSSTSIKRTEIMTLTILADEEAVQILVAEFLPY